MEKLDRLGWADGISFSAYGRRVGIRVNDREVLQWLPRHLPFGWQPAQEGVVERLYSVFLRREGPPSRMRRFHLLYRDAQRLARTEDRDQLFEALESDVQSYVAEYARRRIFVHAGVVGWRGSAIVIPGRSFSGKSTLVAEFVHAGATYYSDEYAVFDTRGRVCPYLRPLSIRELGGTQGRRQYDIETLGGRLGRRPLPVGLILVCPYRQGARWRPRSISAGEGALALLANTVSARGRPEAALSTLGQAVSGAAVRRGVRGEAAAVVRSVLGYNTGVRFPVQDRRRTA